MLARIFNGDPALNPELGRIPCFATKSGRSRIPTHTKMAMCVIAIIGAIDIANATFYGVGGGLNCDRPLIS